MDRLRIVGGQRLQGAVAISGAKNAALPQIAASLLSPSPLELTNLPAVSDVDNMLNVIAQHGAQISRSAQAVTIDTSAAASRETTYDTVRKMRATVLVLGPLLARFGQAQVSLPGGCAIGARPVDMHIKALAQLGADIGIKGGSIVANAPDGLTGARIVLGSPSVGATETAMMAATAAKGETEIVNAAREPEVADLAACLGAMGATIEGAGTHRILVQGDTRWRAASHHTIPDRIEAGTYAIAAAITGGQLELTHARLEHLASVVQILEATGVSVWPGDRGLIVSRDGPLRSVDVTTEPYPGFPTDLQAPFMALMTLARGTSIIREKIYENRLQHVAELQRMGASIRVEGSTAIVEGVPQLSGAPVTGSDLRAAAAMVIAGLAAEGVTCISGLSHLDRGYENIEKKFII